MSLVPAQELSEAFWRHMERKRRVSPCHSTRASSIGSECDRFLVYEQTQGELRALPPVEIQPIFDLGNTLEDHGARLLEDMGFKVLHRARDYNDRRYNITGHLDFSVWREPWPKEIPAEFKGLNPHTAGSIETAADIRDHKSPWVRKYYGQLQTYLFLSSNERGLFILLNKVSGVPSFIDCPIDYEFAEGLLKKAERVQAHVKAATLPDRKISNDCARCPFVQVCNPDIEFGKGVELFDNPEMEGMLARRAELAAARSEFEALDKAIKKALPAKDALLVGDWVLSSKEVSKKAYEVKASTYRQWKFESLRAQTNEQE